MRISSLLYLLTGLVIFCLFVSCKPKQGISVTASAENKSAANDSVILPVTIIVTTYGIDGMESKANDYPKTIIVEGFDTTTMPIAAYGASQAIWLGPKGYTGSAETGADGSVAIRLFPPGGNEGKPPFVRYQLIPACVGCMMSAAAPYFENAKADLLKDYDSAMLNIVRIPDKLLIQKKSATLVTYTYMEGSSLQITGVAYYSSPTDSRMGVFEQAEFALGPNNKAMTDLLLNSYISMWGLK